VICQADARRIPLADGSVHMCVTSPPYWGLRDYGLATWEGGDGGCDHEPRRWDGPKQTQGAQSGHSSASDRLDRETCRCGAVRRDAGIGLEKTLEEYVANIVAVFREVWRVLRDDGTLWLNLGDCYASSVNGRKAADIVDDDRTFRDKPFNTAVDGFKPKDLVGQPWRVALALQADGWYLRSDIIWHKPNPMPESVTDRPTKSHEMLFLLSKRPRYFYDAEAIREPVGEGTAERYRYAYKAEGKRAHTHHGDDYQTAEPGGIDPARGRNRRDVWTIPTAPYKGAHFATFPPKLVEPCVLAGTSARGVCPECGAPWEREVERTELGERDDTGRTHSTAEHRRTSPGAPPERGWEASRATSGWRATCDHGGESVPAVVLDPFCGSGTVGEICREHGRRFVGLDLSWTYLHELAYDRAEVGQLALTPVGPAE